MARSDELYVALVDVGQGDCTVVAMPATEIGVLVDCPSKKSHVAVSVFQEWAVTSIALAVITHSDVDHAGGVVDVVKNLPGGCQRIAYSEDRLWRGQETGREHRILRQGLASLLRAGAVRIHPDTERLLVLSADTQIRFLHPTSADQLECSQPEFLNQCSIVLTIDHAGHRILLGGDAGGEGWRRLSQRGEDAKADVLKLSHHGAWHESGLSVEDVIALVQPHHVLISVGSGNTYGHPDPRTLARLVRQGPQVRIICTEITRHCHVDPASITQDVLATASLAGPRSTSGCPCGGTVVLRVGAAGLRVLPERPDHARVIALLSSPLCDPSGDVRALARSK